MIVTATTTTTLLLESLFQSDDEKAWREFHDRYAPIILAFARRLGLNEPDAADVAQDTLLSFVRDYRAGKYDRSRGRLRSWIIGIVKHRAADLLRAQAGLQAVRGESAIAELPDDDQLMALWDAEHRRVILVRAMVELRATTKLGHKTIRAFELFVLGQQRASAVAAELGLTAQDVYMAKNRVAERLREIVSQLTAVYDEGAGCLGA